MPQPQFQAEPPVFTEIVLHNCHIKVADMPNGGKVVRFLQPNGIAVTLPLDERGIEVVIAKLRGSGVEIARAVPGAR